MRWLLANLGGYLLFALIFVAITELVSVSIGDKKFFEEKSHEIVSALQRQRPDKLWSQFWEIRDPSQCPSPLLEINHHLHERPANYLAFRCAIAPGVLEIPWNDSEFLFSFLIRWPVAFFILVLEQFGQISNRTTETTVNLIQLVFGYVFVIGSLSRLGRAGDHLFHPFYALWVGILGLVATTVLAYPTLLIVAGAAWLISVPIPSAEGHAICGTYGGFACYCFMKVGEKFADASFQGLLKKTIARFLGGE